MVDVPILMTLWDRDRSIPKFWLSYLLIDDEAMAHGEWDYMQKNTNGLLEPEEDTGDVEWMVSEISKKVYAGIDQLELHRHEIGHLDRR